MEKQDTNYITIHLKPQYLNEFILGGIPVPTYIADDKSLVLKFAKQESYINYLSILNRILRDLIFADQNRINYGIQRSKLFIEYILQDLNNNFLKLYPQM